ncbi:hypothetical protein Taro_007043 [Colocasia esculenta]|uniref:Uncharacterized protein n=1 Tax=Colocasia esculenta TaxID=4460 RepID=A0A843TQC6_COLES|nr:hypothetical protein [Colocasia esculenta]
MTTLFLKELLMDANMRLTQRLVLACQQAAQILEEALEATKEIKKKTNHNGKRGYNHDKKVSQMMTLHSPMGMDWSEERPEVIAMECP